VEGIIFVNKKRARKLLLFFLVVFLTIISESGETLFSSSWELNKVAASLTSQSEPQLIYIPFIAKDQNVFYVSTSGSDSNPGSFQAPWRNLQYAADHVPENSTVYVRGGVYTGFDIHRNHLIFASYPGEMAVLVGDGKKQSTLKIADALDIQILQFTVKDNFLKYGTGIKVENSSSVILKDNSLVNNQGFGIVLKDVSDVVVEENDASHNGNAIEIRYGSDNVIIRNNQIYQNDRRVDAGRAAIGVTFYRTSGPILAEGNQLWENHTINLPDPEGAAFEVYAASNITMADNILWENETILETGTDEAKTPCDQITFIRNIAFRINRQQGLILRCASNSLFAHNTFDGLDKYAFDLSHFSGTYGASIVGLRIVNNIVINGRVYSIDTALPQSVQIDYNLLYNPGSQSDYGQYLAYVYGKGNTKSLAEFQAWTGYESHGIEADPLFVNPSIRDYHLQSNSPAIDQGISYGEPFYGLGPDMGCYEFFPSYR